MLPASTDVLIIGGGPAGCLLGSLLGIQGIKTVIVETRAAPERPLQSGILMGQALDLLHRLGFGPALRQHPHRVLDGVALHLDGELSLELDFRRVPDARSPVEIAQSALIKVFEAAGERHSAFHMERGATMTDLFEYRGKVFGAVVRDREGSESLVSAKLTVGADGQYSRVRDLAGLAGEGVRADLGALGFSLPRPPQWPGRWEASAQGNRHVVITPGPDDRLRGVLCMPQSHLDACREAGLEAVKDTVASLDPRLGPLLGEGIQGRQDTRPIDMSLVTVRDWARDGLVLIGDASHACSPILGLGTNFAVQDSVLIAPVIISALARARGGIVPAAEFKQYTSARQRHKNRVTRVQAKLEKSLGPVGHWQAPGRRGFYRAINKLPLKHNLFNAFASSATASGADLFDIISRDESPDGARVAAAELAQLIQPGARLAH